jgi:hypothetical protein
MLTIHKKQGTAVVALLILPLSSMALADGPPTNLTISVDPPAPAHALASYFARASNCEPWSEPNAVWMEIDASLPRRAEREHLRAIPDWAEYHTPDYRVIQIEGDAMVKQQVIARYLAAEAQAAEMPASSVAIMPANYKFRYMGASGGTRVYAFQITPRIKRPGLLKGELWIDHATGIAVHEAGYFVKSPSMFIRRLKITRDVSLRDGVPCLRTTHVDIDIRLAGRAELMITEIPCVHSASAIAVAPGNIAIERSGNNGDTCVTGQ